MLEANLRATGLPWLEARMLAEHALNWSPVELAMRLREPFPVRAQPTFDALCAQRQRGEPIAYILGHREFFGRRFAVSPSVLIPRPETELLCEAVLERLSGPLPREGASVLDLGTGSGAIAVTLACEHLRLAVTATDVSTHALDIARENARRLCPQRQIAFVHSDWFAALGATRFDLIVSNPPYVADQDAHLALGDLRFEPAGALRAGPDGLDCLRAIVSAAPAHLVPGGGLMVEHGYDQGSAVRALFVAAGFTEIATRRDLASHERITSGIHPYAG